MITGSANNDPPGSDEIRPIGEKFERKIFFRLSRRKVDRLQTGRKYAKSCRALH
jgi:hypothetical protein